MSFKIQKEVPVKKVYQTLGNIYVELGFENVEIEYEITDLISISSNTAYVQYTMKIDGANSNGVSVFEFKYSGKGDPLLQAEDELKKSLI